MTDDGGAELTANQALTMVSALEREKRRGKTSRRGALEAPNWFTTGDHFADMGG